MLEKQAQGLKQRAVVTSIPADVTSIPADVMSIPADVMLTPVAVNFNLNRYIKGWDLSQPFLLSLN